MTETVLQYLKRHWKILLNVVTVGALLIIVFSIRHELVTTFENLARVHAWILLLMIPIEMFNYHSQTKLYEGLFKLVGNKVEYNLLYKTALELNFINSVFPSAGISGVSYFGMRLRSDKISGTKAAVVQMIKLVLILLSFEILLIVGVFIMAVSGHINDLTIAVASSLSTLMVIGTFAGMMILSEKKRTDATLAFITRLINQLIHVIRPKHPETISAERWRRGAQELHENYMVIRSNYKELKQPLIYATLANLTEVLAIYVVYGAFGHWVNIGAIILAYAVANFAGLVSVLPGGIGIFEALMTAVLAAAGIPIGLSIPVTVMYRVLNTIIQVPPGYYFYHHALRGKSVKET
ncbi:MAG: lysylphosphatidylglycerol synthase transmembrane domain-containing protein [Candidatus Saccharimonadales bacterium]|jgi:uncharacterized protein (TIRG00374 family)